MVAVTLRCTGESRWGGLCLTPPSQLPTADNNKNLQSGTINTFIKI